VVVVWARRSVLPSLPAGLKVLIFGDPIIDNVNFLMVILPSIVVVEATTPMWLLES